MEAGVVDVDVVVLHLHVYIDRILYIRTCISDGCP